MARTDRSTPTIRDIAAALGVSRSTVSRAFSRPDLISAEVVARVQEMAKEMGYVANPVARALSTGKQGNLAIIVPDIANPFFPPLIRAMQRHADEAGYGVFIGDSDGEAEQEYRLASRLAPQIEGFILASSRMSDANILSIAARRPVVMINRDVEGLSRVLIDPQIGLDQAVASLAQLGHRSIAYVAGPSSSWSDQQRRAALKDAAGRHQVAVRLIEGFRDSFEGGRSAARALLSTGATAAIAFDDFVAHGLLAGLAEVGRSAPQSFSLVGFDDVLGASTYPSLSSVYAPGDEAGRRAVAMLLAELQGEASPGVRDTLATHFIPRATTGSVNRA